MRVLLIDDRDRILLFRDTDPGIPGSHWWITPGGGIDPDESDLEAAVRELEEEAGLVVREDQLLGPVLVRRVLHGYTDVLIDQEDAFYACWVPGFEVSDAGHTEEERLTMTAHHWWAREELASTDEEIWPATLADLWSEAEARRAATEAGEPALPPLRGADVEESTVPSAAGSAT